jgi:hypothetical protein
LPRGETPAFRCRPIRATLIARVEPSERLKEREDLMTTDRDSPAAGGPPPFSAPNAPSGRRKPSTIDLTAHEIERAPDAASFASPSEAPADVASPAPDEAAARSGQGAGGAGSGAAPPTPGPGSRRIPLAALIGVGIASGVTAALVLALGYLAATRGFAPGARTARLAQIEQQLHDLSARPAAAEARALDQIAVRLTRLETALASPLAAPSDPALTTRLAAAEAEVRAMAERVGSLGRRSDEAFATAREARTRSEANAAALADLAKRPVVGGDGAARLALAAAALDRAVIRGEPFADNLATVKALGADAAALAALAPFAAIGLPPAAALARELAALTPALAQAVGGSPREAGWFDRLAANAEKIVRIRPLEEVAGSDPAAVVARIEIKAGAADIAGALAELSTLPASVRAPAEAWIAKAQARAAALAASNRVAAASLAELVK